MNVYTPSHAIRHPWFTMPSSKRKLDAEGDEATPLQTLLPASPNQHSTKRRRYNTLEHGFAHLNLQGLQPSTPIYTTSPTSSVSEFSHAPSISEVPIPLHTVSDASPMDADSSLPVVRPRSVEEPPDVKMKGSSWYEPEKDRESRPPLPASHDANTPSVRPGIVVTDLDDSDDDSERDARSEAGIAISTALLERIRARAAVGNSLDTPPPPVDDSSKALVLFRPLPTAQWAAEASTDPDEDETREVEERPLTPGSDAMDVDP
ncbi:hypothetical protein PLICRDRAFT_172444 [Plicaturopsis crispa FD-325 SS-3]|nr:hypothetical protein PLICRDRAFT_172444 [Plicaturopsis crispa FD-325 SS-3]